MKYKHQQLDIPPDWMIVRNEFYDIDPKDNIPENDKFENLYCQEDLLYLTKEYYHIDLGWYGSDNLANDNTGYCIYLFKGKNWNDSDLIEKFFSRDKQTITNKINEIIMLVNLGNFEV